MKYDGFYDVKQTERYLNGCVIRVKDVPIFVTTVYSDVNRAGKPITNLRYIELGDMNTPKTISMRSKRLNLSPVSLGYVNFREGKTGINCAAVSRIPSRMWKIGLDGDNMHIAPPIGKDKSNLSKSHLLISEALKDTIMGHYLPYAATLRFLDTASLYSCMSFGRQFGIQKHEETYSLIYYKNKTAVGVALPEGPVLLPEYHFLQQKLQEVYDAPNNARNP